MDPELDKLVKKSGHNLHLDAYQAFEEEGWEVDLAPYYVDDISDKPREIDIQASKPTYGSISSSEPIRVLYTTFLFVECKRLNSPVAIRTLKNTPSAKDAVVTLNLDRNGMFGVHFGLASRHHYVTAQRIGKLFDSKESKEIFDALTSAVKSLCFYLGTRPQTGFYYPVVIFDGIEGLHEIHGGTFTGLIDRTIIAFNYSYRDIVSQKPKTRLFYVDFIHRKKLSELLQNIHSEDNLATKFVTGRSVT